MTINRTSITVLLVAAVVVWATVLLATGTELSWAHAQPFSFTVGILTAGLAIFDKVAWGWRPFTWFHHRPDLRGTWQVELVSNYKNQPVRISGYAAIRQTYGSLSIRLMTKDSRSVLLTGNLIIRDDDTADLAGVYQSDPEVNLRGRDSEIHYGAFKLTVVSRPATCLQGHYWTDRHTNGTIRYTSRVREIAYSFADAERLFPTDAAPLSIVAQSQARVTTPTPRKPVLKR